MSLRKDTATFSGYWQLAGGKVEEGEHILAAARRELVEETGIFKPIEEFFIEDCIIGDPSTYKCFIFSVMFDASYDDKILNPEPDKHSDWEWFTIDEAFTKKLMPGVEAYLTEVKKAIAKKQHNIVEEISHE